MNIVIIGDVGSPERHTGDEAVFEVAMLELTARGVGSFTVIAPGEVRDLPLDNVRVIAPIGFDKVPGSAHDEEREHRLEQVLSLATDDALIAGVVDAVATADAVVVAGGGNLAATWPHHVYERVALLEIAAHHAVPAIVCGQTVGPTLTRRQRIRLGHALASARFVGVRDRPSLALVHELGAASNTALQVDDAITLPAGAVPDSLPAEYIALCAHQFDADRTRVVGEVAALAAELHQRSGLPVVLLPNTSEGHHTDDKLADEVAAVVGDSGIARVASLTTTTATADGIRRSAAVVSMRFHPLVFALAAGVPCMGITSDRYTDIKLEGALRHAGLESWRVPTDALATPIAAELFSELWDKRSEIRAHLLTITPHWFDDHRRRWDAIWSAINGDCTPVSEIVAQPHQAVAELSPLLPAGRWTMALSSEARARLAQAEHRFDTAEESAFSLRRTLEARELEIEGWKTHAADLERRLQHAQHPSTE